MKENTDSVRGNSKPTYSLDGFDRRILGALVQDSGLTYAVLGKIVGLSAPATHERVRRLRKSGVLIGTVARVDGPAVGKPFLAFVHVDTKGWGKSQRMMKISEFPEVEEMHSVAGDTCMILKVRTENAHALEILLSQLYALPGVTSSRSYVVLSTYLERPIQAEITTEWPDIPLPFE